MRKFILIMLIGWAVSGSAGPAAGQDVTITADVIPRQAVMGQQLRLQVTIEGKANIQGSPALPSLPDFQVYGGGRSSNFAFVNGQVSSSLNFTYILVPNKAGRFTIGPIQISHNGQTYSTQPIEIAIQPAGSAPAAPGTRAFSRPSPGGGAIPTPPSGAGAAGANAAGQAQRGEAVFITTSVDRREVCVNQPVTLTFRFYSRIPMLSQPQYQPPDTSGFWSEDLPPQRNYVTTVNGRDYNVIEIKYALFPTAAGNLRIGPAQLMVHVQNFERHAMDPFADDFFRGFFSMGQQVPLKSEPITVRVKPLPEAGKPADFTGTVGKWSLSAKLDRKEAKVGEAVTLEVRIFGEGNVKSVGKPDLPALTGFKVYETISSSEVQKQNDRVQGVKIYRTLLRPEVTGELSIPPIKYNYFNPASGKYEKVEVPSLKLKSLAGDAAAAGQAMPAAGGAETQSEGPGVKVMARDIRYLKLHVPDHDPRFQLAPLAWVAGFLLPPLVLLGLWGWQRWQEKLATDPRYARRLQADQNARRLLKHARQARGRRDAKRFYADLSQSLTSYLADQLGASRSGITQREMRQRLASLGADEPLLNRLDSLLDECDFARFAPADAAPEAMAGHELEAEKLLTELSRIVANPRRKA